MIARILAFLFGAAALGIGGLALFAFWSKRRVEAAVPPQGRFVTLHRQRIHYLDHGTGPAIVIIHGLGGQTRNFPDPFIRTLAAAHRVIVLDRPGSGHSTRPMSAATGLPDQAAIIAALIRHLGLHRPLVVGHSLGGALALALALDHPGDIGGLALIAPLTHPADSVPAAFRGLVIHNRWLRLLIAWTLAVPASIKGGPIALKQVFGPDPVPADHVTTGGGLLGLRPSAYYSASTDLVAAGAGMRPLAARYASLDLPVGILFGSGDQILDPRTHGQRAADLIPGATIEFVDGAGHMLPEVHPAPTAAFIARIADRVHRSTLPAK